MKKWKPSELNWIRKNLHLCDRELADRIGVTKGMVEGARIRNGIIRPKSQWGYPKGSVPMNKGKKMRPEVYKKVKRTMFKKGNIPAGFRPVGSVRIDVDGYSWTKVKNPRTWKMTHVILWEKKRGRVPKGNIIIFKDKDRKNIKISNLKLVHRAQLMKLNSFHNYPKDIARAIQLIGALNRQINKRA